MILLCSSIQSTIFRTSMVFIRLFFLTSFPHLGFFFYICLSWQPYFTLTDYQVCNCYIVQSDSCCFPTRWNSSVKFITPIFYLVLDAFTSVSIFYSQIKYQYSRKLKTSTYCSIIELFMTKFLNLNRRISFKWRPSFFLVFGNFHQYLFAATFKFKTSFVIDLSFGKYHLVMFLLSSISNFNGS